MFTYFPEFAWIIQGVLYYPQSNDADNTAELRKEKKSGQ